MLTRKIFVTRIAKALTDFSICPRRRASGIFHLRLGDWSLREAKDAHVLRATIGSDVVFEATLKPAKKPVMNGIAKDGVSFKDEGEASRYFSYTRMEMEGDLILDGETEHFNGSAWMDREFGTWTPTENQKGWDWFSIQLSNETELMCYQLRNSAGGVSDFSSGTFVAKDGDSTSLGRADFTIEPTGFLEKSAHRGDLSERLEFESSEIRFGFNGYARDGKSGTRHARHDDDRLLGRRVRSPRQSRRAPTFWDAHTSNSSGYDRSHDSPNLAYFLDGQSI
jgi:hypothetical protein